MSRHIEELIDRQVRRWNHIVHTLHYSPGDLKSPIEPGQQHPVICISRQLGAGARAITTLLCRRLGYQVLGSSLIDEIARDLNVQRRIVNQLDERTRGEVASLLGLYLDGQDVMPEEYFHSLVRVVEALTRLGGVILLGRGATHILGERAALRVMIAAPLELRVRRLMGYGDLDAAAAREQALLSDRQRADFVRKYWKAEFSDPLHYDLSINTARLDPQTATDLILMALEKRGYPPDRIALHPEAEAAVH